jgi:5'-nucleotidase
MWLRLGVQTDFAMTNTTGIRTDMIPGPVTIEEMFNIFPFNNTITKMQLSGTEVQQMFDFIAGRSQGRGCVSQAQIAGARVILNCGGCSRANANSACIDDDQCIGGVPGSCVDGAGNSCLANETNCTCDVTACAEQMYIGHLANCPNGNTTCTCTQDSDCPDQLEGQCDTGGGTLASGTCAAPVQPQNEYDFATSNYLAAGGSGFKVLRDNTTQLNTYIEQRDALIDFIRNAPPCGYSNTYGTTQGLMACSTDSDCQNGPPGPDFICACPGQVQATGTVEAQTCVMPQGGGCDPSVGRCILQTCRDDVATFHETACQGAPAANLDQCNTDLDACSLAGEECKILSCVDENLGAITDNRVEMIGR